MRIEMKIIIISIFIACSLSATHVSAQEQTDDTGFGEVFGLTRAQPVKSPTTEEEWDIIRTKIQTGDIDQTVLAAFHSKDWPPEFDKDEIFDLFMKQNLSKNWTKNTAELFFLSADGGPLTQDELNAIWADTLERLDKQYGQASKKDK